MSCFVTTNYRDVAGALRVLRSSVYTSVTGDRVFVPDWAIIIVDIDGQSVDTRSMAAEAATTLRRGIRMSVIGVGSDRASVNALNAIATTPMIDVYVFNYSQLVDGDAQQFICINLALKGSLNTHS